MSLLLFVCPEKLERKKVILILIKKSREKLKGDVICNENNFFRFKQNKDAWLKKETSDDGHCKGNAL